MKQGRLLSIAQARDFVEEVYDLRVPLRQMQTAAYRRKLPFFIEPVTGHLHIDQAELMLAYQKKRNAAVRASK